MGTIVFENATIQDSIAKAARVAPTKGEAFDKASGIVLEFDAEEGTATLRATNLDLFYLEVVDCVSSEGSGAWRFHAPTLAGVMSKLPIGSGRTVSFTQEGGQIVMKSKSTTAKFRVQNTEYYPPWDAFDPEKLEIVPDLGARIAQVEWAALDDTGVVYGGVHLSGTHVMATDRYRIAVVECEAAPIYRPITIPSGILKPVIANMRDVAVGIDDGMFLLMPDVSTQIMTRIFEKDYPDLTKNIASRTWANSVKVRKDSLLEVIDRAAIFAGSSRDQKLTMIIGKGEIAVMCADADLGLLGDVVDVEGQADHKRHKVNFTPRNLTDSLNAAPSKEVELFYDIDNPKMPMKIDGGSGFIAIIAPRKEVEPSE